MWAENALDCLIDNIFPWFMLLVFAVIGAAIFIGIPYAIYDYTTADKFSLRKDEWVCSKSHEVSTTTYIMVGNVMVPSTTISIVCDQWSRK